jgi:hypothetical protein
MAKEEKGEESKLQRFHISQRRAVNNAYAALEGEKNVLTFSAFTFEDAVDLQIERIEGEGTRIRPNELERVDHIEQGLLRAVEELKQVPPEQFLKKDEDRDVNT